MSQTLHIFKKDLRFLRLEIGLFLLLNIVTIWLPFASTIEVLLRVAAVYLIARVVHAEAIPGHTQFWKTRPYRWQSLLLAKLIFIVCVLNVPIFVSRLLVLLGDGFPAATFLPDLIRSQVMMFLVICLPAAALAAVTASLVQFTFFAMNFVIIAVVVEQMTVPPSLPAVRTLFEPLQWVWDALAGCAVIAAAVAVIYLQYRRRRTGLSRGIALGVMVCTAICYLYIPWTFATAVQTGLSAQPIARSSLHVLLKPLAGTALPFVRPGVQMGFRMEVVGAPANAEVRGDALSISLRTSAGQTWKSGSYTPAALSNGGAGRLTCHLTLPPGFASTFVKEQSFAMNGTIYLTVFGNVESKTIPLARTPVETVDGLKCSLAENDFLFCAAPLHWPARLVYAKFGDDVRSFDHPVSYSPFPSGLDTSMTAMDMIAAPRAAREVTIFTEAPLEHIEVPFAFTDLKVSDFILRRVTSAQ